jgi:Zn-dependent membrane protease YugP
MNLCLAFFPYYFDPMYFVFMLPGILLAVWAQIRVKSAYAEAGQVAASSGLTGAQAAASILDAHQIHDVSIEPVQSFLGDHYDSSKRVLRLSPDVYHGRSLAALGIAAHEVGHAIQHASAYGPLALRNSIVPAAQLGTSLSWFLIIGGLALQPLRMLAVAGVVLFGAAVLFQLITLPVEFDASRRARAILLTNGMVTPSEDRVVARVLNAAALTYIAAAVTAMLQLLYYASLVFGGRRDD